MVAQTDDPEVMVFVAEALLLAEADMVVARALVDRAVKMNPALSVGWDISGNIRMQGGEYEVVGVARHSETLEPQVVYRPLYNASGLWVRPLAMFIEHIESNGVTQPRFQFMDDSSDRNAGRAD